MARQAVYRRPDTYFYNLMHRVLFVDELARAILAHCGDADVCGASYRHTLFNAAMTCKALHEPAVDLLWNHLPSVMPLMNLIPGLYCAEGQFVCGSQ